MKKNDGLTYGQLEQLKELEQMSIVTTSSQTIAKPNVMGSFNGLSEMCKICSGDGWVYHSKGGQGGSVKDSPKCDGKGIDA